MSEESGAVMRVDDKKLFIGSLTHSMNEATILEYFKTFGDIVDVKLIKNSLTGVSRCFAFVTFLEEDGLEAALSAPQHTLDGASICCGRARGKPGKTFVGNLGSITSQALQAHFQQFGTVLEVVRPVDKITNEEKNYAFVTFARDEDARKLIRLGSSCINGQRVCVRSVSRRDGEGWGRRVSAWRQSGRLQQWWWENEDLHDYHCYGGLLKMFSEPWPGCGMAFSS